MSLCVLYPTLRQRRTDANIYRSRAWRDVGVDDRGGSVRRRVVLQGAAGGVSVSAGNKTCPPHRVSPRLGKQVRNRPDPGTPAGHSDYQPALPLFLVCVLCEAEMRRRHCTIDLNV